MPQSKKLIKGFLILVVILTAREYAHWTWDVPWRAQMIILGLEERPYVYRALVPWLANLLASMGMRAEHALTIMIILSAIALVYGIKYLLAATRS